MNELINSVKKSLEIENYYAALMVALTLPDIAGKVDGIHKGKERYIEWFKKYMMPKYTNDRVSPKMIFMTGEDCYALRCAYLHEGSDDVAQQRVKPIVQRFVFSTPANGSHCTKIDDILQLNVKLFCNDILTSLEDWLKDISGDEEKIRKINEMLYLRDGGFSPSYGVYIS